MEFQIWNDQGTYEYKKIIL